MPFPPRKSLFSNSKAAALSAASPQNPNQHLRPRKKMNAPPRGLGGFDKQGPYSGFAKDFMNMKRSKF